jgi:pyridinium-3,5-biscarboxylic acid mononucleotide sulfurtransferase
MSLDTREHRLTDLLASLDSVVVAFSGGVDSAYLAWAATRVLGSSALCVTADSPSYPDHHRQLALRIAREFQLQHEIIETAEMERAEYRANPVNRCYYCKHELYTSLSQLASSRGFGAIVDGSNADDRADYRPGRQAAREFGVRSPSMRPTSPRTTSASCRGAPACRRGMSLRPRVCRHAFPTAPKSAARSCG